MEIVSILRLLLGHRRLLVAGAVVAVAVGLVVSQRVTLTPPGLAGGQKVTGIASGRVLISARKPAGRDAAADIYSTMGDRAVLLADLMGTDAARAAVAGRAGLPADRVAIVTPAMGGPAVAVPLAVRASDAARSAPEPYVLAVSTEQRLPIISMRVTAPSAQAAARLVAAGMSGLESQVATRPSRGSGLSVERLGPVVSGTVAADRRGLGTGFAAAIVTFGLWCCSIVVLAGIGRRRTANGRGEVIHVAR